MIVDIVDKYCTNDNNPIKNLRLKFSFLFSFSPSEGVAPPPSGPQVGSVHKSAQLI